MRIRSKQLLPAALFSAAIGLSALGAWRGIDLSLYDALLKLRVTKAPLAMSPRIMPIDLNDRAERNLGDKVDNRRAFADLLRVLGEGRLRGGMDFLFSGKKDAAIDAAMADAAGKMDGLVLAIVPIPPEVSRFSGKALDDEDAAILRSRLWHPRIASAGKIPVAETFLLPNRDLAGKARYLGHIGLTPDGDGLYRKTPLLYRWEDGFIPSLPLALAAIALDIDPASIELRPGSELVLPKGGGKSVRVPIDEAGSAWIPYPSLWSRGWKRIPLDKVVDAAAGEDSLADLIDQLDGGIAIAADITTSNKDFGSTPIEPVYPLSGIHTSLLNGILGNTFIHSPSPALKAIFSLILLAGVFLAAGIERGAWLHSLFAALLIGAAAFACALWILGLIVPWLAAPAVGLAFAWSGASAIRLLSAREERILLQNALSRYFPKALAARVLGEKRIDLKPSSKELTLLFADIAGFTKWSSDKSPEVVHGFLSDYLSTMAAVLFDHGGTVDKFIGDGILAFFGDPFDQSDHADRCLRAALAMQAKVGELRAKWAPLVGIDLKIRIGVNSGTVIVGNLGTQTRIEYTVIGPAVNLASRMESNAPVEGILAAKDTWLKTRERFRFGEARAIIVKGYESAIEAYVLEGALP